MFIILFPTATEAKYWYLLQFYWKHEEFFGIIVGILPWM